MARPSPSQALLTHAPDCAALVQNARFPAGVRQSVVVDAGALALRVARSRIGGTLAWLVLGPLRRALPLRVLAESDRAYAIKHPKPAYTPHLLVVPKRRVVDYLDATPPLLESVLELAAALSDQPMELVTNLGHLQEVKLLHFHLIPAGTGHPAGSVDPRHTEELLATTAEAARHALATNAGARVIMRVADGSTVSWRVVATSPH